MLAERFKDVINELSSRSELFRRLSNHLYDVAYDPASRTFVLVIDNMDVFLDSHIELIKRTLENHPAIRDAMRLYGIDDYKVDVGKLIYDDVHYSVSDDDVGLYTKLAGSVKDVTHDFKARYSAVAETSNELDKLSDFINSISNKGVLKYALRILESVARNYKVPPRHAGKIKVEFKKNVITNIVSTLANTIAPELGNIDIDALIDERSANMIKEAISRTAVVAWDKYGKSGKEQVLRYIIEKDLEDLILVVSLLRDMGIMSRKNSGGDGE